MPGYEDLKAIIQTNRDEKKAYDGQPPVSCPWDGTLLDINNRGVRNCPLGDYRWSGGPKVV